MTIACVDSTECASALSTVGGLTTLTFTNGNWNVDQTVTVIGADDAISDGNVSSNISFTVTSTDGVFNGQNFNVSVINNDNELPAKAIWITSVDRNGEMAPGVSTADSYCNGSDPSKPTGLGSPTYKALIVDGLNRAATTTGTNATGQTGWVLQPGYYYYLRTGASGDDSSTRLFIANSSGLITFPMDRGFSSLGTDHFWTGMNADMTTASSNGEGNSCSMWTLTNEENSPFNDYHGQYGIGGVTDSSSINSNNAVCSALKKLICVQQ